MDGSTLSFLSSFQPALQGTLPDAAPSSSGAMSDAEHESKGKQSLPCGDEDKVISLEALKQMTFTDMIVRFTDRDVLEASAEFPTIPKSPQAEQLFDSLEYVCNECYEDNLDVLTVLFFNAFAYLNEKESESANRLWRSDRLPEPKHPLLRSLRKANLQDALMALQIGGIIALCTQQEQNEIALRKHGNWWALQFRGGNGLTLHVPFDLYDFPLSDKNDLRTLMETIEPIIFTPTKPFELTSNARAAILSVFQRVNFDVGKVKHIAEGLLCSHLEFERYLGFLITAALLPNANGFGEFAQILGHMGRMILLRGERGEPLKQFLASQFLQCGFGELASAATSYRADPQGQVALVHALLDTKNETFVSLALELWEQIPEEEKGREELRLATRLLPFRFNASLDLFKRYLDSQKVENLDVLSEYLDLLLRKADFATWLAENPADSISLIHSLIDTQQDTMIPYALKLLDLIPEEARNKAALGLATKLQYFQIDAPMDFFRRHLDTQPLGDATAELALTSGLVTRILELAANPTTAESEKLTGAINHLNEMLPRIISRHAGTFTVALSPYIDLLLQRKDRVSSVEQHIVLIYALIDSQRETLIKDAAKLWKQLIPDAEKNKEALRFASKVLPHMPVSALKLFQRHLDNQPAGDVETEVPPLTKELVAAVVKLPTESRELTEAVKILNNIIPQLFARYSGEALNSFTVSFSRYVTFMPGDALELLKEAANQAKARKESSSQPTAHRRPPKKAVSQAKVSPELVEKLLVTTLSDDHWKRLEALVLDEETEVLGVAILAALNQRAQHHPAKRIKISEIATAKMMALFEKRPTEVAHLFDESYRSFLSEQEACYMDEKILDLQLEQGELSLATKRWEGLSKLPPNPDFPQLSQRLFTSLLKSEQHLDEIRRLLESYKIPLEVEQTMREKLLKFYLSQGDLKPTMIQWEALFALPSHTASFKELTHTLFVELIAAIELLDEPILDRVIGVLNGLQDSALVDPIKRAFYIHCLFDDVPNEERKDKFIPLLLSIDLNLFSEPEKMNDHLKRVFRAQKFPPEYSRSLTAHVPSLLQFCHRNFPEGEALVEQLSQKGVTVGKEPAVNFYRPAIADALSKKDDHSASRRLKAMRHFLEGKEFGSYLWQLKGAFSREVQATLFVQYASELAESIPAKEVKVAVQDLLVTSSEETVVSQLISCYPPTAEEWSTLWQRAVSGGQVNILSGPFLTWVKGSDDGKKVERLTSVLRIFPDEEMPSRLLALHAPTTFDEWKSIYEKMGERRTLLIPFFVSWLKECKDGTHLRSFFDYMFGLEGKEFFPLVGLYNELLTLLSDENSHLSILLRDNPADFEEVSYQLMRAINSDRFEETYKIYGRLPIEQLIQQNMMPPQRLVCWVGHLIDTPNPNHLPEILKLLNVILSGNCTRLKSAYLSAYLVRAIKLLPESEELTQKMETILNSAQKVLNWAQLLGLVQTIMEKPNKKWALRLLKPFETTPFSELVPSSHPHYQIYSAYLKLRTEEQEKKEAKPPASVPPGLKPQLQTRHPPRPPAKTQPPKPSRPAPAGRAKPLPAGQAMPPYGQVPQMPIPRPGYYPQGYAHPGPMYAPNPSFQPTGGYAPQPYSETVYYSPPQAPESVPYAGGGTVYYRDPSQGEGDPTYSGDASYDGGTVYYNQ